MAGSHTSRDVVEVDLELSDREQHPVLVDDDIEILETSSSPSLTTRKALTVAAVILGLIAVVFLDSQILDEDARGAFIGHADRAHVGTVAANIASGQGPVVNTEWLLVREPTGDVTFPQRDSYWPTYPSWLISGSILAFGQDYTHVAVLFTSSLMKLIIAASLAVLLRRAGTSSAVAYGAAFLTLGAPVILRGVTGLTDIYFTASLFATIALATTLAHVDHTRAKRFALVAALGVAVGFCAMSRPPVGFFALLLVGGLTAIALLQRRRDLVGSYTASLLGGTLLMVPWFVNNMRAFGTPIPPGYELVQEAASLSQAVGRNEAFYGVGLYSDTQPLSRLAQIESTVKEFTFGGIIQGEVVPVWLTLAALAVAAMTVTARATQWRATKGRETQRAQFEPSTRRSFLFKPTPRNVATAQLFTVLLLGPALFLVVHFEARYWMFLVPTIIALVALFFDDAVDWARSNPAASAAIIGVPSAAIFFLTRADGFGLFVSGLVIISLALSATKPGRPITFAPAALAIVAVLAVWYTPSIELGPSQPDLQAPPAALATAVEVLPADTIVLNSNPWQYSFHTGHAAVAVPYTNDFDVIRSVAAQHGATYLVVSDGDLRHPELQEALRTEELHEHFPPVYEDNNLFVGAIEADG